MKQNVIEKWLASSALAGENQSYVEALYESFLENPESVGESWRNVFENFPLSTQTEIPHSQVRADFTRFAKQPPYSSSPTNHLLSLFQYIEQFRKQGHLFAHTNPLFRPCQRPHTLQWQHYGFTEKDLDTSFSLPEVVGGKKVLTLRQLEQKLTRSYCHTLSVELAHLDDDEKSWFQTQIEQENLSQFSGREKQQFLKELVSAEGLERYLGTKFAGAKRFSLEGSDAFILMMKEMVRTAKKYAFDEMVFGMAHRGRLNMLVNVLGKRPHELFDEFAGKHHFQGSGDVKYHQGLSADFMTEDGNMHLSLAYNPSHLEIVSPVVQGSVRARQDRLGDTARNKVLAITVHGDSAMAGQGIVQETLNMSATRGYEVGGTIRVVINNQIGFTTSNPKDTRSMRYTTDVAKMLRAPVLHVNGDDAEAVVRATRLAMAYRHTFQKDIFIDLVSYRRHGHNEADEPAMTQPLMYQQIKQHPTAVDIYAKQLQQEGVIGENVVQDLKERYRTALDNNEQVVAEWCEPANLGEHWTPAHLSQEWGENPAKVAQAQFLELAKAISHTPTHHPLHPRVQKVYADRKLMADGQKPFDWGMGETMAYATILAEGKNIRLSGEDVGRATFSHRHAVLHSQENAEQYLPLRHLGTSQGHFDVWDSMLSEEAVLAFEYGYASTNPNTLTIWEAQFGDFANGAQMVIDQFISSGEQKWGRMCGLTLLLPHGYEGQGPEHSSARLERYLQLCAEQNMQVCVPTTPAQIYHLLRRQILRNVRRPLIVITPKSLLRHPLAVSEIQDFTRGHYQLVLPEQENLNPAEVERVIFCSGKVYYELLNERQQADLRHIALVRLEQLYPYPREDVAEILRSYPALKEVVWCQEEPQNQGAWWFIQQYLTEQIPVHATLRYAGRASTASTATGCGQLHKQQQQQLVADALS